MRKLSVYIVLILSLSGCVSRPAKVLVRDKHAQLHVWVQRINDPDPLKRPTPEQNEEMLRAVLKDMESLDRILNNWKPSSVMEEANLDGR